VAARGERAAAGDAGDRTDHRKGTMQMGRSGLRIGSLLVVCAVAGFAAQAEDYPTRSVKLITQGAAASGPDVIARIVAERLGRLWGQQVVILNHPGAGGSVAARQAASAAADGYTCIRSNGGGELGRLGQDSPSFWRGIRAAGLARTPYADPVGISTSGSPARSPVRLRAEFHCDSPRASVVAPERPDTVTSFRELR
jgi:hypothetical protein